MNHKWTEEENQFMKEYVKGHSYKQIQEAFIKKFGWEVTLNQITSHIKRHNLCTRTNTRFQKRHVPHNKNQKGVCPKGCEKSWFPKGHVPTNHKPVGSERITKDGYIEIKTAEPNEWKLKHRVVYEAIYGEIPQGYLIIFRDGDKKNVSIENLTLVSRGTNAIINHEGMSAYHGEMKDVVIKLAELKRVTTKKKKGIKNE